MKILGINAFHGDSSAALLDGERLVRAVEEERFNRIKHWAGLPLAAINWVLDGDLPDHIALSRDPRAHLWRKLGRVITRPGDLRRMVSRAENSVRILGVGKDLASKGIAGQKSEKVHFVEHHRAHMASAFFAAPFEEAAIVSIDGFGDFSSIMWGVGRGNQMKLLGTVHYPHSLGLFYTAFTQFLGFPKYGDEYKMMGLAAYGEPRFQNEVRQLVRTEAGHCKLNLDYFIHHTKGVDMTWEGAEPALGVVYSDKLIEAFGEPRVPRTELQQKHADLACSVQKVLEENYFALLNYVQKQTGLRAVCLAGGVALNCVANGMIFDRTDFRDVYVQPAAHDAGTSIGAALYVQHEVLKQPRRFVMRHAYYGAEYGESEIRSTLDDAGTTYHRMDEDTLVARTAEELAAGQILGWFQGRSEFGPRALGNRSILADPRRKDMKGKLNARIKYREPFRPFCPSILVEKTGDWFETAYPSPFMVAAYKIKAEQREKIPAVTHGDGTGRLQTVERDVNPLYWKLIAAFHDLTGVPVLLNTSFNENEPIVNTPAQALDCFLRTQMDVLVMGPFLLMKSENRQVEKDSNKRESAGSVLHA
jgi:carbamoyltransferase